jgi:hypothetical protein
MFCCRHIYSTKRQILSYFYSKEPVVSKTYEQVGSFYLAKIESVSLDETIVLYKISKTPDDDFTVTYRKIEEPWLWIGAKTPFGDMDLTERMRQFFVPGNHITLELLELLYPSFYDWVYLDPVTFKEVEFPVEGITINAARVETSS